MASGRAAAWGRRREPFKRAGKYYLTGAAFYKAATAAWPPSAVAFSDRTNNGTKAVPCGGGTDYFQDKDGNWWDALFRQ